MLILAKCEFKMLIKIFEDEVVEQGRALIMQDVQVATETDKVCFELSGHVLSGAASANAISCTVMAVPVLIPHDVVYVFFIVCAEAESTKLALALISNAAVWFALAGLTQSWRWVKRGEEVGEKNFNVGRELLR